MAVSREPGQWIAADLFSFERLTTVPAQDFRPTLDISEDSPRSPTFENPVLIVEVISPSNEADTWESIRALAGLTSLQEILAVQSTHVEVQLFRRGPDGAWPNDPETAPPGGVMRLASIEMDLPVAEIYQQTGLNIED